MAEAVFCLEHRLCEEADGLKAAALQSPSVGQGRLDGARAFGDDGDLHIVGQPHNLLNEIAPEQGQSPPAMGPYQEDLRNLV